MVEEDQAQKGGKVEGCLHPEDIPPAGRARVCHTSRTEDTNTAKEEWSVPCIDGQ